MDWQRFDSRPSLALAAAALAAASCATVPGDPAETTAALEKAKPYLRRRLAGELRVRRVPELDFRADDTLDRAQHLEGVLRELADERRHREAKDAAKKKGEGP